MTVLHDHKELICRLDDLVQNGNVWVPYQRQYLYLPSDSVNVILLLYPTLLQDLNRDLLPCVQMDRLPYLAKSPFAESLEKHVVADVDELLLLLSNLLVSALGPPCVARY